MSRIVTRALGAALVMLDRVAPQIAGPFAYDLFCRPPGAGRRTPTERRALDTLSANLRSAATRRVETPGGPVQTYRWAAIRGELTAPRVLLVHGWSADTRIMTLFVAPLLRAGFEVIALDLPAHGQSGGTRLNMPIGAEAVLAVGDLLGPLSAVVAHSFGGLVAALAAEGGSPIGRALAVDRLVLISTPHSVARLVQEFGDGLGFSSRLNQRLADAVTTAAGRPVAEITTGDLLRVAARPTLLIQDDDDDIVPAADGALIADLSGARLHTTKGLGHRRIIVMPTIVRTTVRFLKGEMP